MIKDAEADEESAAEADGEGVAGLGLSRCWGAALVRGLWVFLSASESCRLAVLGFVWRGVQATHGRVVSRADHTPGLLPRVSRAGSRYGVFVWRGVQATHGRVVSRADHTPGLLVRVSRADSRVWVFVWRGVQATLGRVVSNLR